MERQRFLTLKGQKEDNHKRITYAPHLQCCNVKKRKGRKEKHNAV
jgi:hypothetical protein